MEKRAQKKKEKGTRNPLFFIWGGGGVAFFELLFAFCHPPHMHTTMVWWMIKE